MGRFNPFVGTVVFVLGAALPLTAQTAKPAADTQHFSLYENLQGSPSSQGQLYDLDNSLRYKFNPMFDLAVGLPIYFARNSGSSSGTTGTTGSTSGTGLGDAYLTLNLVPVNSALAWMTSLTGYAPTGNTGLGFSTGRALFVWNNHVEHDGDLLSPYVDAGFGNTIPDQQFFTRPYKTLGKVGNFDAGTRVALLSKLDLDVSGYANAPIGTQKVFSRLVHRGQTSSGGGFRKSFETTGSASTAKDDGYSVALEASPQPFLDLSLGYTRSTHLNINAVSFGIGVNVTRLIGSGN